MENKPLLQTGLDGLIDLCQKIQVPWSIKGRSKTWSLKREICTVTVDNKSFTEIGEDCHRLAIKAALIYLIRTYSAFDDMKYMLDTIPDEEEIIQGLA